MRDAISKLPDGEYKYSMETDGFDERFHYAVTVKIKGDEIECDFNGTSDQQPRGINCVMAYTSAMTCYAIKCLLLPNLANNAGLFRSEEHTSELQSLMRSSYAVFCLKKKNIVNNIQNTNDTHHKN